MSIEGHCQGHFLTLFFQVLYILCVYEAQISGERLQDNWSSGIDYLDSINADYINSLHGFKCRNL